MKAPAGQREAVREYVSTQLEDDLPVHVEKVAVERVGSMVYDIWDVHCRDSRWWVVTNPTNMYSQGDFKSRDVVLTFHIGLAVRIASRHSAPISDSAASFLPTAWRMWEEAVEAMLTAQEAGDFQAVGVRLRECLVAFVAETSNDVLVPDRQDPPKGADVVSWTNLLAHTLAPGSSGEQLRSYVRSLARETWDYVSKLTHARNAGSYDAEIGVAGVSHFLATMTAARMRWAHGDQTRCAVCGSYSVVAGNCTRCDWIDPDYQAPKLPPVGPEELAIRLSDPCTPSSDIATFMSPNDYT